MKYKDIITLNRNSRGCYILDTVKGCSYAKGHPGGCYGACYAANIAARYGFEFDDTVRRDFYEDISQLYMFGFKDTRHQSKIINEISKIDMPFVRMGEMGDPSEDWEHTINICEAIKEAGKPIVIITKHWKQIPAPLIPRISKLGLTINTSISAMDTPEQINYRLNQYRILSDYCNSILRVVTCDFCDEILQEIQNKLLSNKRVIDTIFRPCKNHTLIKNGTIKTKEKQFLNSKVLASCHDENIYFGECDTCPDMCGINK